MSDVDLDAAVAAARGSTGAESDGSATRLRIRETLAGRPRLCTRRLTIVAALIASIGGSTAFAYYAGWRPTERTPAAIAPPPPDPEPTAAPIVAPTRVARRESPPPPPPPPPPEPERPRPARVEPHGVEVEMPAADPLPPAPDPELAAYRAGHEAHFRGRDPKAALDAWDAYLAQYPGGKLALEARYSRALVLVKLQRWADARAALQPFADAPPGAYRQAEAAKLLAVLPPR